MENQVRQSLKRFWRNRVLLGVSGLAALGFSGLQLQTVLQHQPQQPSWTLEFSRLLEEFTDERTIQEEKENLQKDLVEIARRRNLIKTDLILVEPVRAQIQVRDLELDMKQEMKQVYLLDLEPMLARMLESMLARVLESMQVQVQVQVQVEDMKQVPEMNLNLNLEQEHLRIQAQMLAQMLVSTMLIETAIEELQQVHGITLHQDDALEALLSSEPNRARVLLQSGILLALSSVLLVAVLVAFTKSKSPYSLPTTAHLVAFLPEECAAEVGALHRRLKKAKASPWEIRLRLCEAFLTLLWVFYIQIRLENLHLPMSDRTIDD